MAKIYFENALKQFFDYVDPFEWLDDFRSAGYKVAEEQVCVRIHRNPYTQALQRAVVNLGVLRGNGEAIGLEFMTELSLLVVPFDTYQLNLYFGENGEFGCHGFNHMVSEGSFNALYRATRSTILKVFPNGFDTIGNPNKPPSCNYYYDSTPVVSYTNDVGVVHYTLEDNYDSIQYHDTIKSAIEQSISALPYDNSEKLPSSFAQHINYMGYNTKTLLDVLDGLLTNNFDNEVAKDQLMALGFEIQTTQNEDTILVFDDEDIVDRQCNNQLTYCTGGSGCSNKNSVEAWPDGVACGLGTTCRNCYNQASWWWYLRFPFTYCGTEPKIRNGIPCLLGTTCNSCREPATWWPSKFFTACGTEPCWSSGIVCGLGTTDKMCCNGADCPWYQLGICTCK